MSYKKSYRQFCGVAKALDLVGERWTLLIVRDLLLGPLRYSDFQRTLVGLTPTLLSKRLRDLTECGLVSRSSSQRGPYELTSLGRQLEPVVLGLGAFGSHFMTQPDQQERVDARWAMLSLKRRFRGANATGALLLHLGSDVFWTRFAPFTIEVLAHHAGTAPATAIDAELAGDFEAWFPLLSGRKGLRELLREHSLTRVGSAKTTESFVKALGLRV